MYPGPYSGTLQRPFKIDPDGHRLVYPSVLAFVPTPSYDPADFPEAVGRHDALLAKHAGGLLFALRRHAGDTEGTPMAFSMGARVGVISSRVHRESVRIGWRDGLAHACSPFPALSRRLVLAPRLIEMYVLIVTPDALTLRTVALPGSDSLDLRECAPAFEPGEMLAVEPTWPRAVALGSMIVRWARTPRSLLQVHVHPRPRMPATPDAEMDRLLDVYRPELLRDRGDLPPEDCVALISSTRLCGDHASVSSRRHPAVPLYLETYGDLRPALDRPATLGWLPVIVHTDMHVGLRWLDTGAGGGSPPAPLPALVLPWKRAQLVSGG